MSLDLFNNLLENVKESGLVQSFIKEVSEYLENMNNKNVGSGLKEEDTLYQVVEVDSDGLYLQNVNTNKAYKESDISEEVLNQVQEDTILKYKNGEYIIEEDLTEQFLDSLVGAKEYKQIQNEFINESNILEIDSGTKFTIQSRGDDSTVLEYDGGTIEVPNELIPFFATEDSVLYYENGKFNRDL